ncbi:MAG: shikimate dehydrogenase [Candidatus Dadabacteria bacterium]|nr:MAG: shikimate dehydrogenase [Candidatus Dadabacteria bacterium]
MFHLCPGSGRVRGCRQTHPADRGGHQHHPRPGGGTGLAFPLTITAATRLYGILGHPVGHSLSPAIHNPEFAACGHDAVYLAFDVPPGRLPAAIDGVRALGLAGLNLTIPHKEAILPLLDAIDPAAARIGAVNTVAAEDGHLTGYNTDGIGFLNPLSARLGFQPRDKRVVILGAGGAVRAVAFALMDAGVSEIVLANRTLQRAEALARDLRATGNTLVRTVAWDGPFTDPALASCDLLIQGTSLGLHDELPEIAWPDLSPKAIVADLVYRADGPTRFLQTAATHGYPVYDGIWMLVGQAAEAFRIWTGAPFDIERAARRCRPDL